jgi:hypothetical protein
VRLEWRRGRHSNLTSLDKKNKCHSELNEEKRRISIFCIKSLLEIKDGMHFDLDKTDTNTYYNEKDILSSSASAGYPVFMHG